VDSSTEGMVQTDTYDLVREGSAPVAKVEVRMDSAGRVLGMKVLGQKIAAK
jgi:hypothetical protein